MNQLNSKKQKKSPLLKTGKPFSVFSLEADRDYILARLINFTGSGFSSRAGYLSQQACEKYFKSLMVQEERLYLKTHDLLDLARHCSKYDRKFGEDSFLQKIKMFDDFREIGRYGGESMHDPNAIKNENYETAGSFIWVNNNIKVLDEIVFSIRSKLDFSKIRSSDSLKEITKNNKRDILCGGWNFPIPINKILTNENDFYK